MLNKISTFFKEVKIEAKKSIYPSKEELIGSVWVVIGSILVVSIFLGIIDMGLSKLIGYIIDLK